MLGLTGEDGGQARLDMTGFPNPSENGLLDSYLELNSTEIDGFGLNSPIYFAFDAPVTLPGWEQLAIEESARCQGPVRIMNIDAEFLFQMINNRFVATDFTCD